MNTTLNGPVLIAGFGSIGRRHLRNLQTLGHKNFVLYRTGKSTLPIDEIADIPTEYSLDKALSHKPIATIITNPTALHMPIALAAAQAGSHLFLEKPISHTLNSVEDLHSLAQRKRLIVSVGFQFRFHPGLRQVKHLLETNMIGPIVNVQAHWGEYLPEWHPWEDYRQSYSAKAELGGGVILTLCHPFDYLRWLIGEIKFVSAVQSCNGGLGIDVEDSADVLLRFASGVTGNVHIDFLERPTKHFIHIIGQNGEIYWNNSDGTIKWRSLDKEWKTISAPKGFERNDMYLDEMQDFLSCIAGKRQPLCSLEDGIHALRIALAAKRSANDGQSVELC